MAAPDIFDRRLRRRARDRAAPGFARHAFLAETMWEEVEARVALLDAASPDRLAIGAAGYNGPGVVVDASRAMLRGHRIAVQADEDRLPFADASFGLVVSAGALHGVNDLPGALTQVRRVLRPGGRLVAAFVGGEALLQLRRALLEAEDALLGRAAARVGPTVDPAQAAALLARAGFAQPVADVETLTARYASLDALARELRGMGETGWLAARPRAPMRRGLWAEAAGRFAALADADGRVRVTAQLLVMTGRAPG